MATVDKLIIDVRTQGAKKTQDDLKNVGGASNKLIKNLAGMAAGLMSAQVAFRGVSVAIERFARFEGVERSFNNLATSMNFQGDVLGKLKMATDSTVDSIELMELANNAMLLGINDSSDQMVEMFDIAQRLAKSVGKDARFGVESLVTGLGRQSKLMLDNLGIMVDVDKINEEYANTLGKTSSELTDVERKQAFVIGTMAEAKSLVAKLGEEQLDTKDSIAALNVATGDFAIMLGESFSPMTNAATQALTAFLNSITKSPATVHQLSQAIGHNQDNLFDMEEGIKAVREQIKVLPEGSEDWNRLNIALNKSGGFLKKLTEETENSSVKWAEYRNQVGLNSENLKDLTNNQEYALNQLTESKKQQEAENEAKEQAIRLNKTLSTTLEETGAIRGEFQQEDIEMTKQKINEIEVLTAEEREREIAFAKEHSLKLKHIDALQLQSKLRLVSGLAGAMGMLAGQHKQGAKVAKRFAQIQATIDTYAAANTALKAYPPPFGAIAMAAVIAQGIANVAQIENQKFQTGGMVGGRRHSEGGTIIEAERGEFVMSRNAVSAIGVENLNRMNQGQSGGGSINISINGGMISPDFVENELAESIREAVRRGADFGIS